MTCEFCRKFEPARCHWCDYVGWDVHHAPFYVGGHGYISIDFCHDGARCDQRQAAKTALKDKVTA